jgi:hypothetical protein
MTARQLVASGSFGPEALNVAFQAFDAAWQTLAPGVGDDPEAIEAARTKLAYAILTVIQNESRDVRELVTRALALMALAPDQPPASPPAERAETAKGSSPRLNGKPRQTAPKR